MKNTVSNKPSSHGQAYSTERTEEPIGQRASPPRVVNARSFARAEGLMALPRPGMVCSPPALASTPASALRQAARKVNPSIDMAVNSPIEPALTIAPTSVASPLPNTLPQAGLLHKITVHFDKTPQQERPFFLYSLALRIEHFPLEQRVEVCTFLMANMEVVNSGSQPRFILELANAIRHIDANLKLLLPNAPLPHESFEPFQTPPEILGNYREVMWAELHKRLTTLPQKVISEPALALLRALPLVPDKIRCGQFLTKMVPAVVSAKKDFHDALIQSFINVVPHVAAGQRSRAAEQASQLLRHEQILRSVRNEPPLQLASHLQALIAHTQHYTMSDDLPNTLQAITALAPFLRSDEWLKVMGAIPDHFHTWQDQSAMKTAVLLIGRQSQNAPDKIRDALAKRIEAGLAMVAESLEDTLSEEMSFESASFLLKSWLDASVVAPNLKADKIVERAAELVATAQIKNHIDAVEMTQIYAQHFPTGLECLEAAASKLASKLRHT